jgi:putative ABC transport system permease protein
VTALWTAIRIALRALARSKLRAALTILGILIGVASVVTVVALGVAVRERINKEISGLGANSIYIFPSDNRSSGARQGLRSRLSIADADALREQATSIAAVMPMGNSRAQVVYADSNQLASVMGVGEDHSKILLTVIAEGRDFTHLDHVTKARVVLLGETVRRELFGSGNPIGERVRIGKHSWEVIGLLEAKGQSLFGDDGDNRVIMPSTSFRARVFPGLGSRAQMIVASASDERTVQRAKKQVEDILRQRHGIDPEDKADFEIVTQSELAKTQEQIFGMLTLLLAGIAAVSLLVGGIGVMNIMLVSVTERTREIGIRMAIGAGEGDILFQFLVEAIVLCLLGGIAGVAIGSGVTFAVARALDWPARIPPEAVALAFATSTAIGVVFGFLPARRAARLDPIDALRQE